MTRRGRDHESDGLLVGSGRTSIQDVDAEPCQKTKVYRRRYYILVPFTFFGICQGWMWNTYGPIQGAVEHVFGWNDSTIALLANWGPITYILSVTFFSWFMNVKGLRWATLLASALVAVGAGIRCISSEPTVATWLNHLGLIFNGLAGPIAMSAPSVISAVWFPPEQRTIATGVTAMANYFGIALSFSIGLLMVSDYKTFNGTSNHSFDHSKNHFVHNMTNNLDTLTKEIRLYQYVEFIAASAAFLSILCYFPNKPPLPPSVSAASERTGFCEGLKKLRGLYQFWNICIVYGIITGVFSGWASVLDVNVKHFGIGKDEAGWIGFYSIIAGTVGALVFSRINDCLQRHTKPVLLILMFGATAAFTWFLLMCLKILPSSRVALYLCATAGGLFVSGAIPLFYEMAAETAYPIPEDAAMGMLTLMNNVFCLAFLLLPMFSELKDTMKDWMNPTMAASCFICIPLLIVFKTRYRRLSVDREGMQ